MIFITKKHTLPDVWFSCLKLGSISVNVDKAWWTSLHQSIYKVEFASNGQCFKTFFAAIKVISAENIPFFIWWFQLINNSSLALKGLWAKILRMAQIAWTEALVCQQSDMVACGCMHSESICKSKIFYLLFSYDCCLHRLCFIFIGHSTEYHTKIFHASQNTFYRTKVLHLYIIL